MKKIVLLSFLILCVIPSWSLAQFEGEIQFRMEEPGNPEQRPFDLQLQITKERIYMGSSATLSVSGLVRGDGILVRNDQNDFIIFSESGEAIQVSKDEIESLVNMINQFSRSSKKNDTEFDWDQNVRETGNTRKIQGYDTKEFVLMSDKPGEYVSFWLTEQVNVNWGMLIQVWEEIGKFQTDEPLPVELIMNPRSFPLLIEAYKDEDLDFSAEAVSVQSGRTNSQLTEIPDGTELQGISQLMMNMFRQ